MSPKTRLSVLGMAITAVLLLASYQGVARAHKHSSEPSATLRKELLEIRESVWRGWFNNDQKALGELLPEELIACRSVNAEVGRCRPVFRYPILAHYSGEGDPKQASSFVPFDPSQR